MLIYLNEIWNKGELFFIITQHHKTEGNLKINERYINNKYNII